MFPRPDIKQSRRVDKSTVSVLAAILCVGAAMYQTEASSRDKSNDKISDEKITYLTEEIAKMQVRLNNIERYGISQEQFREMMELMHRIESRR